MPEDLRVPSLGRKVSELVVSSSEEVVLESVVGMEELEVAVLVVGSATEGTGLILDGVEGSAAAMMVFWRVLSLLKIGVCSERPELVEVEKISGR